MGWAFLRSISAVVISESVSGQRSDELILLHLASAVRATNDPINSGHKLTSSRLTASNYQLPADFPHPAAFTPNITTS
jgi:hypothetical protein